uniref:Troponin I4b, tandem duplicate 2 n=1 Tax=Scleropages formosus TaxID=113540 RepID=A0A8C9WAY7_SCLFO
LFNNPHKSKQSCPALEPTLLKAGAAILDAEEEKSEVERGKTLNEQVPPLKLPGFSVQELQVRPSYLFSRSTFHYMCFIYDTAAKVAKNEKEVFYSNNTIMKRPNLKRVRISADATLRALLGSKHKECVDFKDKPQNQEATDWRNNAEAVSGMEGRKKLFDATQ